MPYTELTNSTCRTDSPPNLSSHARFDPKRSEPVWIEEEYCCPPLAMGRAHVLDDYFTDITVVEEDADEAVAWQLIDDLPELWDRVLDDR